MAKKYDMADVKGRDNMTLLEKVKEDYSSIDLDHLLIYVMAKMEENQICLSFPNMTISAWKIFPKKFSIFGWPKYPDSSRISTGIWHLKDKGKRWITGTNSQYLITEKGRREVEIAEQLLKQPPTKRKYHSKTRKQDKLLIQVKKTAAYIKYIDKEKITQFDLYDMLQCTLDSSKNVLKENYDALLVLALDAKSKEMIDFLNVIKENFEEIKNA